MKHQKIAVRYAYNVENNDVNAKVIRSTCRHIDSLKRRNAELSRKITKIVTGEKR